GMSGDDITMIMKKEDLKLSDEDKVDIAMAASGKKETSQKPVVKESEKESVIPPEVIFRKYDIRGIVGKSLTPEIVEKIGQAIGSAAAEKGEKTLIVGRDARLSGPELMSSLITGLQSAGRDVIDIGVVPTPVLYFATHHLQAKSGVMLTGSHNGPEYNGLKIVLDGNTLSEDGIVNLYQRIKTGDLVTGSGKLETAEIIPDYIRRISEDIPVALGSAYKLVVDCGNGVAGAVAPQLFKALGHDVIELYCELDGNFPNHHPDPSQPENMQPLIDKVRAEQADLGFAFDGDGDRLGVVDSNGNIIWPDRQMMIFARDVLSRNQGAPIIFDVKCSSHLARIIEESGGKPLMWKTGHSLIKGKMKELNAPLAGEMSGHIFFKERWYGFDDALYAGARLLEILMNSKVKPADFFAQIPDSVSTPELKIDMPESEHQPFMQQLESGMSFENTTVIKVDGLRVEFSDGWGLIRPSNTTPALVARFEAENQEALDRIRKLFRELITSLNPDLKVPF
ncbi:MAG: phosphomannomutase/phosphoglucomutase, partial [Gammaproteobacteria bacterium]